MALFITFEGGEGSGKTYQAEELYRRLVKESIPAILIREPGGTPLGEKISQLLKWAHNTRILPLTELLLFNASRVQLVDDIIRPGLKEGKIVICDRYSDSTTVYQSNGRGLDLKTVKAVNETAKRGVNPDITFLLDLPVDKGFARKKGEELDRFEQEEAAFHERVRTGYLNLASEEPERWMIIDATLDRQEISEIIWEKVQTLIQPDDIL